MEPHQPTRVLIVANRASSTPRLIEAVRSRGQAGPCQFALLIPDVTDRKAADWTLETAQRLLRPAARGKVEGLVGGPDPFESVKEAVHDGDFAEIIISTLPRRVSKWLRRDVIRRVEGLGLPVTAIVPKTGKLSRDEQAEVALRRKRGWSRHSLGALGSENASLAQDLGRRDCGRAPRSRTGDRGGARQHDGDAERQACGGRRRMIAGSCRERRFASRERQAEIDGR